MIRNILKFGWYNFSRNKGLNLQVIFIMAIVVSTITLLFLFQGMSNFFITEIEKRVDISVFFKKDASEEDILRVRDGLAGLSQEIKTVDYITKEMALARFQQRHSEEPEYLEVLEEIQENPLSAHLDIKASDPGYYVHISNFLEDEKFSNVIDKISYNKSKQAIERLISITSMIKKLGIVLSAVLIFVLFVITFSIIKLLVIILKDEITAMRLVGAGSWLIRMPFIFQSILCGIFAVILVDALLFLGLLYLNVKDGTFWGFSFLNYFQSQILVLCGVQLGLVTILGCLFTIFALKKHLKK